MAGWAKLAAVGLFGAAGAATVLIPGLAWRRRDPGVGGGSSGDRLRRAAEEGDASEVGHSRQCWCSPRHMG